MITTNGIDRIDRNIYLRYVLKMLVDTYLINQAQVAHRLGVTPKYLREFANGQRNLSNKTLDEIEYFITDLYKPLLKDELPDNKEELVSFLEFLRPPAEDK